MRLGILDVGSQGAHLDVFRLRAGEPLRALSVVKRPTRLAAALAADGTIGPDGLARLVGAVDAAARAAQLAGVRELLAFGTSSIRDAPNRAEAVDRVAAACGIRLGFLTGADEARLTYRAARAWSGAAVGALFLVDIGGGTVELAAGTGPGPDWVLSAPLGAGLLTRRHLPDDPPSPRTVERLRSRLARDLDALLVGPAAAAAADPRSAAVATSKTFTQLALLTRGRDRDPAGPDLVLSRRALQKHIPRLAELRWAERARLAGVSASRAPQILAGALLADALMAVFGLAELAICPWALREGIALTRLQQLEAAAGGGPADRPGIAAQRSPFTTAAFAEHGVCRIPVPASGPGTTGLITVAGARADADDLPALISSLRQPASTC